MKKWAIIIIIAIVGIGLIIGGSFMLKSNSIKHTTFSNYTEEQIAYNCYKDYSFNTASVSSFIDITGEDISGKDILEYKSLSDEEYYEFLKEFGTPSCKTGEDACRGNHIEFYTTEISFNDAIPVSLHSIIDRKNNRIEVMYQYPFLISLFNSEVEKFSKYSLDEKNRLIEYGYECKQIN